MEISVYKKLMESEEERLGIKTGKIFQLVLFVSSLLMRLKLREFRTISIKVLYTIIQVMEKDLRKEVTRGRHPMCAELGPTVL